MIMDSAEQKPEIDVKPLSPAIAKLLIAAQEAYQKLVIIMEQERAKPPPRLE